MSKTSWVEICVSDFEQSINWFENVLGILFDTLNTLCYHTNEVVYKRHQVQSVPGIIERDEGSRPWEHSPFLPW